MDLYTSLFNFFEESDIFMDRERRKFLKAGLTGAVSLSMAGNYFEPPEVSEEELDEIYEDSFSGFDEENYDVLVDVIEVGENTLQQQVIEDIESIYKENGVNLVIGRRKQKYPEDKFQRFYGGDAAKILGVGRYNGFFREQVSYPMRGSAVQAVVSPGKPDYPEGWLEYKSDNDKMYRPGFATDSIALGSDNAFREGYSENDFLRGKSLVLMHELGHAYGLEHSDNPSNVMHGDVSLEADLDYTETQWERIKRSI